MLVHRGADIQVCWVQLLVIFDADMVCSQEFFTKIVAELYDPQVALVLTPQVLPPSYQQAMLCCKLRFQRVQKGGAGRAVLQVNVIRGSSRAGVYILQAAAGTDAPGAAPSSGPCCVCSCFAQCCKRLQLGE